MPEIQQHYSAFTQKNNKIINRLLTPVTISQNGKNIEVVSLWDTGATGTSISEDVVKALGLVSIGKQRMHTPAGTMECDCYLVDLVLPNNVPQNNLMVFASEIGAQGIGLLVGMDIISQGDFAISNYNGTTAFTFRFPSKQLTDYAAQIVAENIIGTRHGKGKKKHKK